MTVHLKIFCDYGWFSSKEARKSLKEERPGISNSTLNALISVKWKVIYTVVTNFWLRRPIKSLHHIKMILFIWWLALTGNERRGERDMERESSRSNGGVQEGIGRVQQECGDSSHCWRARAVKLDALVVGYWFDSFWISVNLIDFLSPLGSSNFQWNLCLSAQFKYILTANCGILLLHYWAEFCVPLQIVAPHSVKNCCPLFILEVLSLQPFSFDLTVEMRSIHHTVHLPYRSPFRKF